MKKSPADSRSRPILLFGGSGQVGRALLRSLGRTNTVVAPPRSEADLSDPDAVRRAIRRVNPSAIVNAAALTNVDLAEREPEVARILNEQAPGVMAEEAARNGTLLVHYSTDYVFDGAATAPYTEADSPDPINTYGASKLAGERAVAGANGPHLIIRTSWVYSPTGAGFVPTFLRDLRVHATIRVVSDQVGSPTWSSSLSEATAAILDALRSDDGFYLSPGDAGVYHLGGSGAATRVEIARHILGVLQDRASAPYPVPVVVPVSATEFAAAAQRPRYSALANGRVERRFGVRLSPWREELARMLSAFPDGGSTSC